MEAKIKHNISGGNCDDCGLPLHLIVAHVELGNYSDEPGDKGRPLYLHPWCYAIRKKGEPR